jgi:hypothetical protein
MPIHRQVDPIGRLLHTRIIEPLTMADIRQHVSAVRSGRVHGYLEIIDARRAGRVQLSARDMLEIAHQARRALGHQSMARRAFVVGDQNGFRLARTFAALVSGWVRVGVFEDPRVAEAWLRGPFG